MARHRTPEPDPAPARPDATAPGLMVLLRVARRVDRSVLVWVNAMAAGAMFADTPGSSPTLLFLAGVLDLRIWGALFAAAAVLLLADLPEPGHVVAFVGWVMLGYGAVAALVTATTPSPSGSILGAGLMSSMAALHAFGVVYRAGIRRAATRGS